MIKKIKNIIIFEGTEERRMMLLLLRMVLDNAVLLRRRTVRKVNKIKKILSFIRMSGTGNC